MIGPFKIGYWVALFAAELIVATVVSGLALVLMSGFPPLPDGTSSVPLPVSAFTVDAQRSAFVKTFAAITALFVFLHLLGFLAFSVKPGVRIAEHSLLSAQSRQRLASLVLLGVFVAAWASAWLDTWAQVVVPRSAAALPLAWCTAAWAALAAISSWRAAPGWIVRSTWLAILALASAAGVALSRGTALLTIVLSAIAIVWLLLDGRGVGRQDRAQFKPHGDAGS